MSVGSGGDVAEQDVQLATSRGHGLAGGWRARAMYSAEATGLHCTRSCCAVLVCAQVMCFFFVVRVLNVPRVQ